MPEYLSLLFKTIDINICCSTSCQVLLGSELIKSSVEERSLLKNLGSWLGKITIGRNQVLRGRDIDPKSLIIEVSFLLFSSLGQCRLVGRILYDFCITLIIYFLDLNFLI